MDPLQLLAAFIVGTITVARLTRLVVHDAYPPAKAVRGWWVRKTSRTAVVDGQEVQTDGPWTPLAECPFCSAPYLALAAVAWAAVVLPGGDPFDAWSASWWWWLANLWGAVSYLAAMIEVRDEPE